MEANGHQQSTPSALAEPARTPTSEPHGREAPEPSAIGNAERPGPLVAVAKYRFRAARASWLWRDVPVSLLPLEVMPLCDALAKEYPSDAHLVGYVVRDVTTGQILHRQPRVGKDQLRDLRRHGFDLEHHVLAACFELKGHRAITPDVVLDVSARLAGQSSAGWYSSRARLTIVQGLVSPISSERHEAVASTWLHGMSEVLGRAWVVDRTSAGWTAQYRLPWVTTGGEATRPGSSLGAMATIAVPPDAQADPGLRALEGQHAAAGPSSEADDDESNVVEAWRYLQEAQVPACGAGRCTRSAWRIGCVLLQRFGLPEDDALVLLAEWAGRGSHGWTRGALWSVLKCARKRVAGGRVGKEGTP